MSLLFQSASACLLSQLLYCYCFTNFDHRIGALQSINAYDALRTGNIIIPIYYLKSTEYNLN